jgi:hypothetical protein
MVRSIEKILPGSFEDSKHFYPKALNAAIHPMVSQFFNLDHKRIISRFCHLNPQVDPEYLDKVLKRKSKHFFWGGSDLFYVTTESGNRKMVVLETNSCPSGQKSMPALLDFDDHRGYRRLIEQSFIPSMKGRRLVDGCLAVIYDKNYMEVSGYASTLADIAQEPVYLVPFFDDEQKGEFEDGILYIKNENNEKIPVRAAIRYVTQKPWKRIPVHSKTFIYNSTLVCLSGGRNKLVADKAYEIYNTELNPYGLEINTPETIKDVSKVEIPLWVKKFGGHAVVKVPYSNAGQGVFTITNPDELQAFMDEDFEYDQFIVQSLIGHYNWSSISSKGKFYHIGTLPNKKGSSFVADVRIMIISTPEGYVPAAIYARRARKKLESALNPELSSWEILGTNLSEKLDQNLWSSDTERLLLMDRKDFNTLGIGIDDLINGYIQTVLSVIAIDKMAVQLVGTKNQFKTKLFKSLDSDESLIKEIKLK